MQRLYTLVPTDFMFRTALLTMIFIVILVLALSANTSFKSQQILELFATAAPPLVIVTLFELYFRMRYRVSYTDQAVHWRNVGFSRREADEIVMPFETVSYIYAVDGSLGAKPFEAAILQSEQADIPDIILSRLYLQRDELRDFLAMVVAKSDARIDEKVSNFIA